MKFNNFNIAQQYSKKLECYMQLEDASGVAHCQQIVYVGTVTAVCGKS